MCTSPPQPRRPERPLRLEGRSSGPAPRLPPARPHRLPRETQDADRGPLKTMQGFLQRRPGPGSAAALALIDRALGAGARPPQGSAFSGVQRAPDRLSGWSRGDQSFRFSCQGVLPPPWDAAEGSRAGGPSTRVAAVKSSREPAPSFHQAHTPPPGTSLICHPWGSLTVGDEAVSHGWGCGLTPPTPGRGRHRGSVGNEPCDPCCQWVHSWGLGLPRSHRPPWTGPLCLAPEHGTRWRGRPRPHGPAPRPAGRSAQCHPADGETEARGVLPAVSHWPGTQTPNCKPCPCPESPEIPTAPRSWLTARVGDAGGKA